jgi:glycine hydroxymethyltransferase
MQDYIFKYLDNEYNRQESSLEMIPSENFVSKDVLRALGSIATNKYAEGYPGRRYYGGCENMDAIELLCIDRAKQLFNAEHVNVQPLSGAPANLAAYFAFLSPGDTILGMDLAHGGHLTHGHPVTHMANIFNFIRYKTTESGEIDYNEIETLALQHKPKMILVGYSAYSHDINYDKIKEIADKINAYTMADISHIAGLIAAKQMNNPVPLFDVVTTTTHKTLRGPRGGMILCKKEHAQAINKSIFPGLQGGPHMNVIAAKAVAFAEALKPEFIEYSKQVMKNARVLSEELARKEYSILFGGTTNHLMLIDVFGSKNITGHEAEVALDKAGITVNKNMIPHDTRKPLDPSGIRIGTPALTTRGMKEDQMIHIANLIDKAITNHSDEKILAHIREEVKILTQNYPIYP